MYCDEDAGGRDHAKTSTPRTYKYGSKFLLLPGSRAERGVGKHDQKQCDKAARHAIGQVQLIMGKSMIHLLEGRGVGCLCMQIRRPSNLGLASIREEQTLDRLTVEARVV